jgi:hypothetical protein
MSGIEKAFKDFVKRVSEKEDHEQKSAERGFQYGGGAIGYADGGRIEYSSGSGLPPIEEDQAEQLFGQNIQTPPTGFNFQMNPPALPTVEPGQEPIAMGNFRNFKTMMSNVNPQLGYVGDNFGGNVSAMMNPFINSPKSYSANAYYGPEQNRYNLGITTIPTAGVKQLSAGYESPYGNFNLGASRDRMGKNYNASYNLNFADGGRAVEPFYINEMTDKISDPTIGGMAGMIPTEVAGGVAGLLEAKTAKGLVDTTVKLTKKEQSYLKELMNDNGGGKFTAEILEQAPSLKIKGDKLIVKQKDLQNLDKFLQDLRISEQAPSGPGANTIPPRLRDFSTDNNVVRQLYRNTPGYTGYAEGGYISQGEPVDTDLTRTIPPDSGPNPQGVETLFKRRYN